MNPLEQNNIKVEERKEHFFKACERFKLLLRYD